ncbi:uncharacterized protein K02A2.6-like [Papilio machaon]|uniref:uncharacterized protein K02A2.6-like n=1 Tax=Papilio machaon TaxID=76193 RepID=UPI001E662A8A|nr:uncharacterized protein K02A2.6-like [Papilio machaon]
MGMLPGLEKEEIFGKDLSGLTLARVVELAENIRCARAGATCAAAATSVVVAAPTEVLCKTGQPNKSELSVRHLRRMCKKVNLVTSAVTRGTDENDDDGELYHIRSFRGEPMVECVRLNGARPIAFALREKVTDELNRLVDLGVLKPVDYSEYASPIVPVLKRNGSVRICADYSLCLDEESQKLTCINTHRGLYQYTRLVFGLSSAPAIFQRAMETVLAGLDGVLCLLDDILITGLANYYRNFVPGASMMLSPLYELLKKNTKWKWTKIHSDAFLAIKKCLASDSVLAHFNQKAKLILTVDASPTGLGAILSQVGDDGVERPVSFASRTLTPAEHSADNTADYLSRASLPGAGERGARTTEAGRASCADAAAALCDRAAYVCFVVDGTLPMTVSELRHETAKDVILSRVMNHVLNGWPNKVVDLKLKPYFLCRNQLSVENGCLMRGHKVIIPSSLRKRVMDELHTSHLGVVKTKADARSRFWFPGVDEAIENFIGSCEVCTRLRPSPPRAKLVPWRFPPQPFYRVHIDFLGPLNGRTYLVVVDSYTKWVEVYDMNANTTSCAVVERLYEYIARYGLPKTIVSDNGPSFASQEFSRFCAGNGISHLTTPAYHPASNGQAESSVKVVKKGIRSSIMSSRTAKECKLRLLKFLFDYRNSIHSTTGFSPAELVYGCKLRSRLDLINPKEPSSSFSALADVVHDRQQAQIVAHGGKNKISFSPGEQDNATLVTTKKHKNQLWLCKADVTATNVNSRDVDDDDDEIVVSIPTSPTSSGQPGVAQGISDGEQPEGEGEEACSPPHTPLINHPNVTVARGVRRPAQSEEDDC